MILKSVFTAILAQLLFIYGAYTQKPTVEFLLKDFKTVDTNYYLKDLILVQDEKQILGFFHPNDGYGYLKFDRDIEKALKSYFSVHMPFSDNKKPLTIKVNKISLASYADYCITELSVGFYTEIEGNVVELIQTGTVNGLSYSMRPSKRRGRNILNAFTLCFKELSIREANMLLRSTMVTQDSLYKKPSLSANNVPILTNQNRVKGVFHGFGQFIDDLPDTTVSFKVYKNADTNRVNVRFNQAADKDVWGICDGENYYYKFGNDFYKISIDSVISVYIESKDLGSNADVGGLFGGLIGYGIVRAVETTNSKPVRKELDLLTGRITTKSRMVDFIVECDSKPGSEPICIYHNENEIACLNQGEFYRFKYSPELGMERIVLKSGKMKRTILLNPIDV